MKPGRAKGISDRKEQIWRKPKSWQNHEIEQKLEIWQNKKPGWKKETF